MNWQHLVYFRRIVETKTFSQAADSLYITPSALSKAIRSIEEEIGFPLFEKQGRKSILTKYGKEFYPYVCQATDIITEGLDTIKDSLGLQNGHVNISGNYTLCADYIPLQLKAFNALYPNISFSISYNVSGILLEQLLDGIIDLGFCGDYDMASPDYQNIQSHRIKQEELTIIVPRNHPLAGQKYIDFEKIKNESYIMWRNANAGLGDIFLNFCKKHNINPHTKYEVHSDHTILEMVSEGLGIALMPDSPSLLRSNVSVLRFKENPPVRNLYIVWKKNGFLSLAASTFRDFILKNLPLS